jgi:YidC/Oxa1 family membrane protein insertase
MKALLKVVLYQPLFNLLAFLTWLIPGHNIGMAIIALTLLIRIALIPSSNKAIRAQKKIKDLNPQIEELKKKYPDKQEQAKQMMTFYKVNKINPLSSCLPLLIQLPILFIMYYVFRTGLTTDRYDELLYSFTPHVAMINTKFLWMDLLHSDKLFILPVLAGLMQFIQSRQMVPTGTKSDKPKSDIQDIMQKQMLYILPFTTVLISLSLPSALSLYWVASILITIIQQKVVMNQKDSGSEVSVSVRQKNS